MGSLQTKNSESISILKFDGKRKDTGDGSVRGIDDINNYVQMDGLSSSTKTIGTCGNEGERISPRVMPDSHLCVLENADSTLRLKEKKINEGRFRLGDLSRHKKYLLLFCILGHFMTGLSVSLLAPFYPQVAQRKGMSLTLIGITFSILSLMNVILSPIVGAYMTKIGPKFIIVSCSVIGGVCNILYGTLDKCPPGTYFIVASLVCRVVEGISYTAYCVTILTTASVAFSEHSTTAISLLQTAREVGLVLGPGIGGFLYELGGFGAPFYIVGTLIVLDGIVLYKVIPNLDIQVSQKRGSAKSLLRSGLVIAAMASVSASSIGISFLTSTLANHLEPLNLSTSAIGLLFTIAPFLLILLTPIVGFLTDTKEIQSYLIVIGQLVYGLGFYFIGPGLIFPFLHLKCLTVISGLVLIGLSFGCGTIPPFKFIMTGAIESGMEDSVDTRAIVTSVHNSMYYLGDFVGPLIGSALIEHRGYRFGYTVIGGWNIAVSGLCLVIFLSRHMTSKGVRE